MPTANIFIRQSFFLIRGKVTASLWLEQKNTAISFVVIEILRNFAPEVREKDSWTMLNSRSNYHLVTEFLRANHKALKLCTIVCRLLCTLCVGCGRPESEYGEVCTFFMSVPFCPLVDFVLANYSN